MYAQYRGRSHIKKLRNSKNKITLAERKIREARKKLEKLFPGLQYYWLTGKHQSIYQHSLTGSQKLSLFSGNNRRKQV